MCRIGSGPRSAGKFHLAGLSARRRVVATGGGMGTTRDSVAPLRGVRRVVSSISAALRGAGRAGFRAWEDSALADGCPGAQERSVQIGIFVARKLRDGTHGPCWRGCLGEGFGMVHPANQGLLRGQDRLSWADWRSADSRWHRNQRAFRID